MLPPEPVQLVLIKRRRRLRDAVEREPLDQLLGRKYLIGAAGVPAKERQRIDHRLGQIAAVAVRAELKGGFALFDLRARLVGDQRQVDKGRSFVAQRLE